MVKLNIIATVLFISASVWAFNYDESFPSKDPAYFVAVNNKFLDFLSSEGMLLNTKDKEHMLACLKNAASWNLSKEFFFPSFFYKIKNTEGRPPQLEAVFYVCSGDYSKAYYTMLSKKSERFDANIKLNEKKIYLYKNKKKVATWKEAPLQNTTIPRNHVGKIEKIFDISTPQESAELIRTRGQITFVSLSKNKNFYIKIKEQFEFFPTSFNYSSVNDFEIFLP